MKFTTPALAVALAGMPTVPALAHEAGGLAHLHPHGGEALAILVALTAVVVAWRFLRR
jgi:hypothetical protein